MIVVDASATVLLFSRSDARAVKAAELLKSDPVWVVPEYWRIEFLSSIRGLELRGAITRADAQQAKDWLAALTLDIVYTALIADRIWELRHSLTAYDAG